MKIESVVYKTVLILNGVEHILKESNYTESVIEAQDSGIEFEVIGDVINFIKNS